MRKEERGKRKVKSKEKKNTLVLSPLNLSPNYLNYLKHLKHLNY